MRVCLVFILATLCASVSALVEQFCTVTNKFGAYKMRWQRAKPTSPLRDAPTIVCVHGFGGNADQFRKNLPAFAEAGYDTYAIDLLGYGFCDKPDPKQWGVNEFYNFDTWSEQCLSFVQGQIKGPVVLVCNSIGGVVGLQSAIKAPEVVKGVVLVDISLRLLHEKKQNPVGRPFVSALQTVLRETGIGPNFFKQVATPKVLRNILNQAYAFPANLPEGQGVDDETLDIILQPGLDPGAAAVFLDFISYR
jgi:pimeloyl-ACP methyl ester carboxylesterase